MKPNVKFWLSLALLAATLFSQSSTAAPDAPAGLRPSFKGPLGLQLYSLRAQFGKDVSGTLEKTQKFGIKDTRSLRALTMWRRRNLKRNCSPTASRPSAHTSASRCCAMHLDTVVSDAQTLGLKYVGCAWIPHKGDFDEKTCREAAAVFNHAGEVLAKHGMKFFYHVHGYEFQPYKDGTLLDLIMAETDPQNVHFEMDIFWIVFPGQDPVKLLEKFPNRWELMHLKDMDKDLPTGSLSGGTDVKNDVALGTGQINMPAVLSAAEKSRREMVAFIEDESPELRAANSSRVSITLSM